MVAQLAGNFAAGGCGRGCRHVLVCLGKQCTRWRRHCLVLCAIEFGPGTGPFSKRFFVQHAFVTPMLSGQTGFEKNSVSGQAGDLSPTPSREPASAKSAAKADPLRCFLATIPGAPYLTTVFCREMWE